MKKHPHAVHHEKVAKHAESLIMATAHIADDKVNSAREKLKGVLETAQESIEAFEERAMATAKKTDEFIHEKPYHALGITLLVGTLLGFCLARRK